MSEEIQSICRSSDVAFPEKYFPENFGKFSGNFPKNRKNMFDSQIIGLISVMSSTANSRYFVYDHIIYNIKTKQSTSIRYF